MPSAWFWASNAPEESKTKDIQPSERIYRISKKGKSKGPSRVDATVGFGNLAAAITMLLKTPLAVALRTWAVRTPSVIGTSTGMPPDNWNVQGWNLCGSHKLIYDMFSFKSKERRRTYMMQKCFKKKKRLFWWNQGINRHIIYKWIKWISPSILSSLRSSLAKTPMRPQTALYDQRQQNTKHGTGMQWLQWHAMAKLASSSACQRHGPLHVWPVGGRHNHLVALFQERMQHHCHLKTPGIANCVESTAAMQFLCQWNNIQKAKLQLPFHRCKQPCVPGRRRCHTPSSTQISWSDYDPNKSPKIPCQPLGRLHKHTKLAQSATQTTGKNYNHWCPGCHSRCCCCCCCLFRLLAVFWGW